MTTLEVPESHLRENPYDIAKEQLRRVAELFAVDPNLVNVEELRDPAQLLLGDVVREHPGTRGLSRHAQHCPRAVEGRDP